MRHATIDDIRDVLSDHDIFVQVLPEWMWERVEFAMAPGWVAFGDYRGVALVGPVKDGKCEIHWLLTPAMRGPEKVRFLKECLHTLFTDYGVDTIIGATPRTNRPARAMNRLLGARPCGESVDSQGRECINYELEKSTWATLSAASSEALVP